MLRIAVIGLGLRLSLITRQLCTNYKDVRLVAVADPDQQSVLAHMRRHKLPEDNVKFYDSANQMLEYADQFDGIMIGTQCHLHTPMAIKVPPTNLPLFLEKPVAISHEQVRQLADAYRGNEHRVIVSFPLRVTPVFNTAMDIIRSGRLGTINQLQAYNNVSYGGAYYGQWYREYDRTGGLWLQKATHDFDYLTQVVACPPRSVTAMMTQKIYGGDKPHDLRCSACDETATCPESPQAHKRRDDTAGMDPDDHWCVYGSKIKNQDAGSAIIRYEDDTIVSYDQNFASRRSAAKRGVIVTGYDATMEFGWYPSQVHVIDHHSSRVDRIECPAYGSHGGGDDPLIHAFVNMMQDEQPGVADLKDGLLSVAMCLAARDSCENQSVEKISSP